MLRRKGTRKDWLIFGGIAAELVFFLTVPVAFLVVYVSQFHQPYSAVIPHLGLVILGWFLLAGLRIAAGYTQPNPAYFRLGSAALLGGATLALFIYYLLVWIGLSYWNHVITWDLIRTYSRDFSATAAALEIPLLPVVFVLIASYLIVSATAWTLLRYIDWTDLAAREFSPRFRKTAGILLMFLVCLTVLDFYGGRLSRLGEPLSLTFFPLDGYFQNHVIDGGLRIENEILDQRAREAYLPTSDLQHRNLILIVVDGLRPDHMGVLGYSRNTTPRISELKDQHPMQQVRFAMSTCSESLCGLMAIAAANYVHRLSDRPFTLHEILRLHGYEVHMLLAGDHSTFYGLRELYGEVDSFVDGHESPEYMNEDRVVLDALDRFPSAGVTPVLLQIHLMSAHLLSSREGSSVFTPSIRYGIMGTTATGDGRVRSETVVNFYDNGVVAADKAIGGVLERLEVLGYLTDALVVITSDHGEALGEHGVFGHAKSVHGPGLNVPLILLHLGHEPAHLISPNRFASLVDLAPTIARELGLPVPVSWVGEPLQDPLSRDFTFFQQGQEVGLIDHRGTFGAWKFWVHVRTGESFAFHLGTDPTEDCNLIEEVSDSLKHDWIRALEKERMLDVHRRTTDRVVRSASRPTRSCSYPTTAADSSGKP